MRIGDILFVKSSEEPVIALADYLRDLPSDKILVRRPIIGQDGTRYESFEFFRAELETPEEKDIRMIEDIKRRHRLTQAAQKESGVAEQFNMFAEPDPGAIRN